MSCDRCEEAVREGSRFCPYCGEVLGPEKAKPKLDFDLVIKIVTPILIITLIAEFLCMWTGIPTVLDWIDGRNYSVFIVAPGIIRLFYIDGIALDLYWFIIVAAITASVAILLWEFYKVVKKPEPERSADFKKSSMYWLVMLFCVDLLISMALGLATSNGDVPDFDTGRTGKALFEFANAAFWEETCTRVLYIGVPMAVAALICKKEKAWKYIFGGFGFSRLGLVLLVIASFVFGYAHMSGWGWWKVLPTFIAGLIMGYLYMRFGLHVAIVNHFITDYLSTLMGSPLAYIEITFVVVVVLAGLVCLPVTALKLFRSKDDIMTLPTIMPEAHESFFFKR